MVITNKTPFDEKTLDQLPDLKYIGVLATGYNVVDIEACRKRGIAVTNVPEYGTFATAQMTIALLLEIADKVGLHSASVMSGEWVTAPQFSYFKAPLIELADKRLHIVGFGKIGRRVAAIASALGMKVSATPHNLVSSEETVEGYTVKMLPLEEGLAGADVVTLHCPLTPETNALINEERLSFMKDGAILLNCSRGPVIDESAVRSALDSGKLSGFGADVVPVEEIGQSPARSSEHLHYPAHRMGTRRDKDKAHSSSGGQHRRVPQGRTSQQSRLTTEGTPELLGVPSTWNKG